MNPILKKILKVAAWTLGVLVAIIVLLLAVVSFYLTPERLTPLIEKYGSEYLTADVNLERAEITIWSSFPSINLELTGLELDSRSLDSAPDSVRRQLPSDYKQLLELGRFEGSINPWALLAGRVSLGDIRLERLNANLVAVDSTLTNYMIVPPSEEKEEEPSELPRIDISSVKITGPGVITYCSVADSLLVKADVNKIALTRLDNSDKYAFSMATALALSMPGVPSIKNLPFNMGGELDFCQKPMSLSTDNLHFTLATIGCTISTSMDLQDSKVDKLEILTDPVPLLATACLIPAETLSEIPMLKGLESDAALSIKASLLKPYNLMSAHSPDMSITFAIPATSVTYTDSGHSYKISKLALSGDVQVSSDDAAAFNLSDLTLQGEGLGMTLTGNIDNLTGDDPYFNFTSKGTVDFNKVSALFPPSMRSMLKGVVDCDASVKFRLNDITDLALQNIIVDGNISFRNLLLSLPSEATRFYSRLLSISFGSNVADMPVTNAYHQGLLMAKADITDLKLSSDGVDVGIEKGTLHAGSTTQLLQASGKSKSIIPVGVSLTTNNLIMDSSVDSLNVRIKGLSADASIRRDGGEDGGPLLSASLGAKAARYADPDMRLRLKEFSSNLNLSMRSKSKKHTKKRLRAARHDKSPTSTNENVYRMEMEAGIKKIIRKLGIHGNISAQRAGLIHRIYPAPCRLSNISLDFSLDSVRLHRLKITSEDNSLSLAGSIRNLRQFLLGRTRKPVEVRLYANIDSVNINQIAYNYERGAMGVTTIDDSDATDEMLAIPTTVEAEPYDTLPLQVPRNIDAEVRLNAGKVRLTDLDLLNASGNIYMKDGALSIDSLRAATDFGSAYLNMLYSSRDINDLNMSLDLGFDRINITNFFNTFTQVKDMMPIAYNLKGMVSAKLAGSFGLYPNMDIDMNSLNAVLDINGSDLALSQDPFIRKIMRLMLIRKSGDVPITDMNIQLSVHDNMMRLYPFAFSMDKYKFAILGENDFNQNMYYHLSVLKSPIPFKFGINIKGTFDKPKIRFGGAKYKENEALEIGNLVENHRVNFVNQMRLQLHKLVRRAAITYSQKELQPVVNLSEPDTDSADEAADPISMIGSKISAPTLKFFQNTDLLVKELNAKENSKKKGKKKK